MGSPLPNMTLAAYLDWENAQVEKHEFVRGEVFAMVGGRRVHGLVLGNAFASLKQQLRGTPCRVFADSMKLQIGEDVFYPDVFVTCDPDDLRTEQIFRAPKLLIEVLSPSTEGYDRGLKFALYRGCRAWPNTCSCIRTRARQACSAATPTACSRCTTSSTRRGSNLRLSAAHLTATSCSTASRSTPRTVLLGPANSRKRSS